MNNALNSLAKSLLETRDDSTLLLDTHFRVQMANHVFYETFHLSREETEGRHLNKIGGGQWQHPQLDLLLEQVRNDQTKIRSYKLEYHEPFSENSTLLADVQYIHGDDVSPDLILLVIKAVNAQKLAPIKLFQSSQNLTPVTSLASYNNFPVSAEENSYELNIKLAEQNRELTALHEIGQTLASSLDIETVYRILYREVAQKLLHVPSFLIALYNADAQTIQCAFAMIDGKEADISQFPVMPLGKGPNSETILTRQPKIVDLEAANANGTLIAIGEGTRPKSALYIPFLSGDKVIGVMNFQAYDADAFENAHLTFLATIASQAAVTLENVQLYDSLHSNVLELAALYNATSYLFKSENVLNLGSQIVQAVVTEFGHMDCGLVLLEKDQKVTRIARTGLYEVNTDAPLKIDGPGLIPEALRTGDVIYGPDVTTHPLYLANNPQTRSELVVPLRGSRSIVGVLDLQSPQIDAFSQTEQRLLSAFAERAAAAIENMILYEKVNRYTADLEWRVAQRTAEFHRTKDRVEAVLNNSSDAIILVKSNGAIQQTNPAFSALFGYESDEIFGQPFSILFDPVQAEGISDLLQNMSSSEHSQRIELTGKHRTGLTFDVDIALALMVYDADERGIICSLRDITHRKQLEQELRKALEKEKELNELKSRFVSMVSHEFRTPLSIILSSADLVRTYEDRMSIERRMGHLDKIITQVKRLTAMLDDVLTLSRAESVGLKLNRVEVDVEKLCRELVDELQAIAAPHRIIFSAQGDSRIISVDTQLINRALTNLLSNAIKYSPEDKSIFFDLVCATDQVIFCIKDEGIGIPPEDQEHLFKVFHRAKNVGTTQGTGLGLTIVKNAVESHGGTVKMESQLGIGTTFTITLPLIKDK